MSQDPVELTIEPQPWVWPRSSTAASGERLAGVPLDEWRRRCRQELGLGHDRPIIATGHQTMLWHPGILAKYLLVDAVTAKRDDVAAANLVVDQHTDDFGRFEIPVRDADGTLDTERIVLTRPRSDVPMARHPAFEPATRPPGRRPATASVDAGVKRILAAVAAHRDTPNAAVQMALALDDLMRPWIASVPRVCASDLMNTSLARALLAEMVDEPARCVGSYNAAIRDTAAARIPPLVVNDQKFELPLWRLEADDRRRHADVDDVREMLQRETLDLMPRALFLTLLVRVGMCDLFVHGTGGAAYDEAMELWLRGWLGLTPAPIAVATATLRLGLASSNDGSLSVAAARHGLRRAWHDPPNAGSATPLSPKKRQWVEAIAALPRRSPQRRREFNRMHERLESLRQEHHAGLDDARRRLRRSEREVELAGRRDWPFPLYPDEMINALAESVTARVRG